MLINLYLHDEHYNLCRCYGELSEVVNKMLEYTYNAGYDWCNKPACPPKEGGNRYVVNIQNEEYIKLYELHGSNSPVCSLRRFVYWFIDNELFDEFGWEPTRDYINFAKKKIDDKIEQIVTELSRLKRLFIDFGRVQNVEKIEKIITDIVALR